MPKATAPWLRSLVSVHHTPAPGGGAHQAALLVLRAGCVVALAWIGYIHLHLWQEGYRQIPVDGPLFLLDAVAAFAFGLALIVWPRPLIGLLAAGFTAGTLGALLVSLSTGLFGFHESIYASYVVESIVVEAIVVLALLGWTVLAAAPWDTRPGGAEQPAGAPGQPATAHVTGER